MLMQCFIHVKSQFSREKIPVLPIEKFPSIICQVLIYKRLKTKENFKLLALKEVPRGSKYSDLTWKLLVFWKTGHNQRFDYILYTMPYVV